MAVFLWTIRHSAYHTFQSIYRSKNKRTILNSFLRFNFIFHFCVTQPTIPIIVWPFLFRSIRNVTGTSLPTYWMGFVNCHSVDSGNTHRTVQVLLLLPFKYFFDFYDAIQNSHDIQSAINQVRRTPFIWHQHQQTDFAIRSSKLDMLLKMKRSEKKNHFKSKVHFQFCIAKAKQNCMRKGSLNL